MIKAVEITTGLPEAYRNIIYHEAKHLQQTDCIDHAKKTLTNTVLPSLDEGISSLKDAIYNTAFRILR